MSYFTYLWKLCAFENSFISMDLSVSLFRDGSDYESLPLLQLITGMPHLCNDVLRWRCSLRNRSYSVRRFNSHLSIFRNYAACKSSLMYLHTRAFFRPLNRSLAVRHWPSTAGQFPHFPRQLLSQGYYNNL